MVGTGKPRRSSANDGDPFSCLDLWFGDLQHGLQAMVAHESLQPIHSQGFVKLVPVAGLFTGMVTDATTDTGKRVLLHDNVPGPFEMSVPCLSKKKGDIDSSWASLPTRSYPHDENRPKLTPVSSLVINGGPSLNDSADRCSHNLSSRKCS